MSYRIKRGGEIMQVKVQVTEIGEYGDKCGGLAWFAEGGVPELIPEFDTLHDAFQFVLTGFEKIPVDVEIICGILSAPLS